ncbi:MAG: DUF296 domain-containing protein [Planctomycetes bacterium]|nr:DUF296 domain-containing protein [Planctomycetota bacterium]
MKSPRARGRIGRIVAFRLESGADLIEGLREKAEAGGMRAGTVQSLTGGIERAVVEVAQAAPGRPFGIAAKRIALQGPLVICSGQGTICIDDGGRVIPEVYVCLADGEGHQWGGRLEPGSAPVADAIEGAIIEVKEASFRRVRDEESGRSLFNPVAE